MKYFFIIIFCSSFLGFSASASELSGRISTDPKSIINSDNNSSQDNGQSGADNHAQPSNSLRSLFIPDSLAKPEAKVETVAVLAWVHYPERSLLRGSDKRIYLCQGDHRKAIRSLAELANFRGQIIYDVPDEIIWQFESRNHLDGDLIRHRGTHRIYHIEAGRLVYVPSLLTLIRLYPRQAIYDLDEAEFATYL